jgi:hypothetical protein
VSCFQSGFGMVPWSSTIIREASAFRAMRIPIPVYYAIAVVDVMVGFVGWGIGIKKNQAWYLTLKIIFDLILLVIAILLTLTFLVFLERSFRNVSGNVVSPERKVKQVTLRRKILTAVGIEILVLILGLIVVRSIQDTSVAVDMRPWDPYVYEWNSNSWTGASPLLFASIGIRMFLFEPSSKKAVKTASRHSNRPVAELQRQPSDQEGPGPRQPSVGGSSLEVTQKIHVEPHQEQIR